MSIKHKIKDRNGQGRIERKYTSNHKRLKIDSVPKAWANRYMNRPKRRAYRRLCQLIVVNPYLTEAIVFPPQGNKPHFYYL
ncbi:hypothetical protein [Vibrio sp. PNB22_4_1]